MQVGGALQGGRTILRRGRLQVVLAILVVVVIAVMVALLVWAAPLATSGVGAEDAIPSTGSAAIHDDPWNLPSSNAGSAIIHDDAGYVNRN